MSYPNINTFFFVYLPKCDRVYEALFDINYYLLEVNDQKLVLNMLMMAQRPTLLYAGLKPLNMDTFLNVRIMV